MSAEIVAPLLAAGWIGLVHTLLGPDHYVPFVAMAKARRWSMLRTGVITSLCGLGHVCGSILLGSVGIALGVVLAKLEWTESIRGEIAAWLLTAFGLVYLVWGIRRAIRNKPHTHSHLHPGQSEHLHEHTHRSEHAHPHTGPHKKSITPWVLFVIFLFGPCEPLIPILMYPAAAASIWSAAIVAAVFAAVTVSTMLAVVLVLTFALDRLPTGRLERYSHALAGAAILMCGVAIHFGL